MTRGWPYRFAILALSLTVSLPCASSVQAEILWADLTGRASVTQVVGVIGDIQIAVSGPFDPAPLLGLAGEPNYWAAFPATYSAPLAGAPNAPATSDMIRVTGPGTYLVTFSAPVTDPVMAIASLGGAVTPAQFNFGSQPIVLLNQGSGAWGAGSLSVTRNTIEGREGNGVIRFPGTITQIMFTMPTLEVWVGFTVGVAVPSATPPALGTPVHGLLGWDYPPEEVANIANGGFRIFRAVGVGCDIQGPLVDLIDVTLATQQEYADLTIPIATGRVCYEISAWNDVDESPHSNRAEVEVEVLIPAVPGPITVQAAVE